MSIFHLPEIGGAAPRDRLKDRPTVCDAGWTEPGCHPTLNTAPGREESKDPVAVSFEPRKTYSRLPRCLFLGEQVEEFDGLFAYTWSLSGSTSALTENPYEDPKYR
jgi:hypothetical protein